MVAKTDITTGQDLTPSLPPLSFSLYTSSLLTHCSACSSPNPNPNPNNHLSLLSYCSPQCSLSDSPLSLSSAELHLPRSGGDTSDLRAALRLLRRFEEETDLSPPFTSRRIGGLMSNHDYLVSLAVNLIKEQGDNGEVLARIRDGSRAMAKARRMRDGLDVEVVGECEVEETILCVVLTNAVEVQVSGGPGVGIAVYDVAFSWINHSCSPNACYRFSLQQSSTVGSQMLIVPASNDEFETTKYVECNEFEQKRVGEMHGPRIVVRSIKAIGQGGEVFVAYTDLLKPKAMRQSELWSKYGFICCCQRCVACPPSSVDRTLQEIFVVNYESGFLSSDYGDEANERFAVHVDDAIYDYLMYGNPNSCCEKLERLLINGILDEHLELKEAKSKHQFFLHPLHHLSLNAYTALSSAYKIRASELLDLNPNVKSLQIEAFDMYRISAAYSLLLTCAIHHLFLSESSLVVSVANFWIEAGDSLLNIARRMVLKSFPNLGPITETVNFFHKYRNYTFSSMPAPKGAFEEISREFFDFVTGIIPKVWPFLVHKGCYLNLIKDPIDFSWIETIDSTKLLGSKDKQNVAVTNSCGSRSGALVCSEQEKINLFQLGVHCLLYGGYLSSTFCGKLPHSSLYTIFDL